MDCLTVATKTSIPANERGLLTAESAAEYLSISKRSFERLVASKDCTIKPRRLGALVRFKISDLNQFIEQLPAKAGEFKGVRHGDDLQG
jgi:excisionase family DNA binding protein